MTTHERFPCLCVGDTAQTIAFYASVFGATRNFDSMSRGDASDTPR